MTLLIKGEKGRSQNGYVTEQMRKVRKTYTPLGAFVAVQIISDPTETPGGIQLPESAKDGTGYMPTPEYRVIAVGPDVKHLTAGMKVLIGRVQMSIVNHPEVGNETFVLEEKHVLGIVDDEKPVTNPRLLPHCELTDRPNQSEG